METRNIKDFIHLYLGCECMIRPELDNSKTGTFIGFVDEHKLSVRLKFRAGPEGRANLLFIKPILRPLSDMTEEEILEVCKLTSPSAFGDYRFSKWQVNKDEKWSKNWKVYDVTNNASHYSFVVDVIDGDIMLYDDGDYEPSYMNNNYRFWYLSHRFDLFNLIPEGLAIDKTTLK